MSLLNGNHEGRLKRILNNLRVGQGRYSDVIKEKEETKRTTRINSLMSTTVDGASQYG